MVLFGLILVILHMLFATGGRSRRRLLEKLWVMASSTCILSAISVFSQAMTTYAAVDRDSDTKLADLLQENNLMQKKVAVDMLKIVNFLGIAVLCRPMFRSYI